MTTPVNPKKYTDVSVIENPHSVLIFHSERPAKHPSQPARADQGDFSRSPDTAAVSGDWSAQSPPPVCHWDRIHPQCAPTPPKSAAVQQIEPRHFRDSGSVWVPNLHIQMYFLRLFLANRDLKFALSNAPQTICVDCIPSI